jgi:hypothetical protein
VHVYEFRADRDHAMCNVQNRTIPVVQRMQFQLCPLKPFRELAFSIAFSALVQRGGPGNGGAWLKELVSLEAAKHV